MPCAGGRAGWSAGPRPATQPAHKNPTIALPGTNHVQSTSEWRPKMRPMHASVDEPDPLGVAVGHACALAAAEARCRASATPPTATRGSRPATAPRRRGRGRTASGSRSRARGARRRCPCAPAAGRSRRSPRRCRAPCRPCRSRGRRASSGRAPSRPAGGASGRCVGTPESGLVNVSHVEETWPLRPFDDIASAPTPTPASSTSTAAIAIPARMRPFGLERPRRHPERRRAARRDGARAS